MTPEGRTKDAVKKMLKEHGAYYHMPVQNGMGQATLDFNGCMKGRHFSIETKYNKKLTPRQELTKADIEKAGGKVFVIGEHVEVNSEGERNRGRRIYLFSGMAELETWLLGLLS